MRSPAIDVRPIDHLVLPVADLDAARARLSALGFTVAPDGAHPFGTANCCIYLADGSFLEPLAVADRAAVARAAEAGNVFVARDRSYRARNGEEGFSALVMGTGDARADDARFRSENLSAGEMLAFSRPFVDAGGRRDTASFLLAFAADPAAAESFFFTCERVNAPQVDRSALERHANSVVGIAEVVLSAPDPARFAGLLQQVTGGEVHSEARGIRIATRGATLSVLNHPSLQESLGIAGGGNSLRLRAVSFVTADLAAAEAILDQNNVAFEHRDGRIIVAPAAGQGAHFIFEVSR